MRAPFTAVVLAEDVGARVEALVVGGQHVLRKTYTTSPLLLWRTALRRSRAQREFDNLHALRALGLPTVQALDWSATRSLGCVTQSVLLTVMLGRVSDLRDRLAAERDSGQRRAIAVALGGLVRRVHAAGLCSTTLTPRNVLCADTGEVTLTLCDQPFAARVGRGRWARRLGTVDLFDTFFSPRRIRDWSRVERWRGLLEYCAGDRAAARRCWARVVRRWRWTLRLDRELARLLSHFSPPRGLRIEGDSA